MALEGRQVMEAEGESEEEEVVAVTDEMSLAETQVAAAEAARRCFLQRSSSRDHASDG